MPSKWLTHLKAFYAKKKKTNPAYKYSTAMKEARASYKSGKDDAAPKKSHKRKSKKVHDEEKEEKKGGSLPKKRRVVKKKKSMKILEH